MVIMITRRRNQTMGKYPYSGPSGEFMSHRQTISDLGAEDRQEMMELIKGLPCIFRDCEKRLQSYGADEQSMDIVHHQLRQTAEFVTLVKNKLDQKHKVFDLDSPRIDQQRLF
jgi:hypothetical protein